MLDNKQIVSVMKNIALNKNVNTAFSFNNVNYSVDELNKVVRDEFLTIAPDYKTFRENKNKLFSLMEQVIDEVLPIKVLESYGQFADIKNVSQGEKAIFVAKITNASRARAKQFIGKVGLAGKYEIFKLDGRSYEVEMNAIGGAVQIGMEEFLDGRFDFSELMNIVLEGLDDCIYIEIQKALVDFTNNMQAHNKYVFNGFDEATMDKAVATASAYGRPTIYCTQEFASTMFPTNAIHVSDDMKNTRWEKGYLGLYKGGTSVVVLPQSFTDDTNATKVIDPQYAWIIPTGAEKPVKIAFEGGSVAREVENQDWSRNFEIYKKYGVKVVASNDLVVYQNTALSINN